MVRNEHDKAENYRCRSYIYAPDGHGFSPLAQLNGRGRGGQIYYYFNDQLGTPQELVTVNGDIVWSAVYKSYGNLAVEYQSVPQPIRLPGQYFDEESGLHYNRYRYYDPYSARYFSQDPIGLEGGENAYSYVPDPLTWIDPLGLDECPGTEVKNGKSKNLSKDPVVTEHIIVSSGKAPKVSTPNSIYEVSRADGTKSITYYNEKGNWFSREDYGQQKTHGTLGYDKNGKVPPHEHKQTYKTYNDKIFTGKKYYRRMDENGKPIGPWILDKK